MMRFPFVGDRDIDLGKMIQYCRKTPGKSFQEHEESAEFINQCHIVI